MTSDGLIYLRDSGAPRHAFWVSVAIYQTLGTPFTGWHATRANQARPALAQSDYILCQTVLAFFN